MTKEQQLEEYIRCKNSLSYFFDNYVFNPTNKDLTFEQSQILDASRYFKRLIVDANDVRQVGKSLISVAHLLWTLVFETDVSYMLVSSSSRISRDRREQTFPLLNMLPVWMRAKMVTNRVDKIQLENGNMVRFITASPSSICGINPSHLVIDDLDKKTEDELWMQIFPVLQNDGSLLMITNNTERFVNSPNYKIFPLQNRVLL